MRNTNVALAQERTQRALIIGGGIGGLLAGKVLSDYYEEVLIVDRDDFPNIPKNRPGTPQAFQPHRLTPRGKIIMERLFPGLTDDLLTHGASLTKNKIFQFTNPYGKLDMLNTEKDTMCSRALLEWIIRQRMNEISNVNFLSKREAIGLESTPDQTAVTGIHIRERGNSRQQNTLSADMVLDASGRSYKLTTWLRELGKTIPAPDRLKVSLGYSTRHYKIPSHLAEKWELIQVEGQPAEQEYTGIFAVIENNIAEMLLWGVGENYPPTNAIEYEKAIANLTDPIIAGFLQDLKPIKGPRGYRINTLFRHHFEQMQRWPSGLLVLGDAFCNFDPIYGQGMTMAAIEVDMLETCLHNQLSDPQPDFERNVLQRLQNANEPAWWLNCVADLKWPGVEYTGNPLKGIGFAQKYLDFFVKHATIQDDSDLYLLFWAVTSILFSPRKIFNPKIMETILNGSDEGKKWLTELSTKYGQPLDKIIDDLVPRFSDGSFV